MKKKYILFIITIIISFWYSYNALKNTALEKKTPPKIEKIYSQRKSYVKGKIKQDSPNKFAEYHRKIRTKIGETSPSYKSNYRIIELKKALKNNVRRKRSSSSLTWISRGPGNVGGRSRGIIIDPDDTSANTWYIAAVGGGVWKTTNAGNTWRELTSGIGSLSASYMAMASSNHNTIYLGTGEGFGNLDALGGQGVWKSTDRGESWMQLESTANDDFGSINRIIVDPNNENILLAATSSNPNAIGNYSKIWKSTDGGMNWQKKVDSISAKIQQIISDPQDFNIQYATIDRGVIIKTTNAGENWHISLNLSSSTSFGRVEMAISPSNTDILYASIDEGHSNNSSIYASKDKGISWQKLSTSQDFLGGQGWYDNAIIVNPYDPTVFFVAGVDIFKIKTKVGTEVDVTRITNAYGSRPITKGIHVDHHFFATAKLPNNKYRIVGTNDGGVCFTDNEGENFTQPISGFITSQFYGVDKANGKNIYVGGMQDNSCYVSKENPDKDNWNFVFGGDGFDVAWNYADENKVMVSSQYNNIAITHSGINNINSDGFLADVDKGSDNAPFFTKLAQSKQFSELVFTFGKNGIWRTDDFGNNWTNIKMPELFSGKSSTTEIKISLANPSIVWAGESLFSFIAPMFVSEDLGYTFTKTKSSSLASGFLSGFATHPTDEKTAYALFSTSGDPKIIKTTDLGQTWTDISGFENSTSTKGFPDVAVYDLLVMPYDTTIVWVGTEIGIVESTDNGDTWHMANIGLPHVAVHDMIIVNDQVIIGTHGRGVWSTSIPELQGYEPPHVSIEPKSSVNYLFDNGIQYAEINLRFFTSYKSSKIYLNDELKKEYSDLKSQDTKHTLLEISAGKNNIKIISKYNDEIIEENYTVDGIPLKKIASSYFSDFNVLEDVSNDFYGDGFYAVKENNFDNIAIHTPHPYKKNTPTYLYLKTPIEINKNIGNSSYKDIAITNASVSIEASKNGKDWVQLIKPYNSTYNSLWDKLYKDNKAPTKSNFITHTFNLLDYFSNGDIVLIRFALLPSPLNRGWGWVIDDFEVQQSFFTEETNTNIFVYPNPIQSITKIVIPENMRLKNINFNLFSISGKLINSGSFNAENIETKLPFSVNRLKEGVYVFVIEGNNTYASAILIKNI